MDKDLSKKLVNGELTEEEFRRMLTQHQENVDKLRKQREANRLKSLQLLQEKNQKQPAKSQFIILLFQLIVVFVKFCNFITQCCKT